MPNILQHKINNETTDMNYNSIFQTCESQQPKIYGHTKNTFTQPHQSATQGDTNHNNIIRHNTSESNQPRHQQRTSQLQDITQKHQMTTEDNNYEEENRTTTYEEQGILTDNDTTEEQKISSTTSTPNYNTCYYKDSSPDQQNKEQISQVPPTKQSEKQQQQQPGRPLISTTTRQYDTTNTQEIQSPQLKLTNQTTTNMDKVQPIGQPTATESSQENTTNGQTVTTEQQHQVLINKIIGNLNIRQEPEVINDTG
jgi:hypothetical protein